MNWEFAITGIVTLVVGIFGSTGYWSWKATKREKNSEVYKRITEIEDNVNEYMDMMKKSIMGIEYLNVVKHCEGWIERGWVDQDDLRDLQHYIYDPYRQKGGNGTAERIFNQAARLPHKPPKEEVK